MRLLADSVTYVVMPPCRVGPWGPHGLCASRHHLMISSPTELIAPCRVGPGLCAPRTPPDHELKLKNSDSDDSVDRPQPRPTPSSVGQGQWGIYGFCQPKTPDREQPDDWKGSDLSWRGPGKLCAEILREKTICHSQWFPSMRSEN